MRDLKMKVQMIDIKTQGARVEEVLGSANIKDELVEKFRQTLETGEGPTPALQLGPTTYEVKKIGKYPSGTVWFAIQKLEGEMKFDKDA